jgi:hypothetical protein
MAAQSTFPKGRARRLSGSFETLAACGPVALALVGLGGVTLGLLFWYAAATYTGGLGGSEFALILAVVAGLAAAFGLWYAYGFYFARRAGIDPIQALRWDAPSWAVLAIANAGFLLPGPFGNPSREFFAGCAAFALVKLFTAARFVRTVRDVLITFVVTRISIIVVAELASIVIAQRPGEHIAESSNSLLAVWGRWDAVHYLDIAANGYYGTDMAFFPLYPALIHVVGSLIGSGLVAGLIISNAALFFGLLFFYKLVEHQFNRAVALRAIFYVSIFPTAIFFSAVYTESLFFALTVASFYYIRERRWIYAGILGALAAFTRVEGVLLVVPLLIEVFTSGGSAGRIAAFSTPARALRVVFATVAIVGGLAAYMVWLWLLSGDPLYFSHVQSHWDRHLAPPWVAFQHGFKIIATGLREHSSALIAGESIELGFTILMLAVLVAGFRRLRPSFVAYMVLSIVVPMSTSSLMSMPRFALVLFPMFIILALWGGRASVNSAIVAFSLPLLGLFTVLFADWYWVA